MLSRLLARLRGVDNPAERFARVERQNAELLDHVKTLNHTLADISRRESQLRAVLTRDTELEDALPALDRMLLDAGTGAHIAHAIERVKVRRDPCPYAVVDNVLPKELYAAVIRGLPPVEVFSDRPLNKQQLTVPFHLAPLYSQRVWRFLADVVVPQFVVPAVVARFRPALDEWIVQNWPEVPPASVELHNSDGRIMLRRRGYRIPPHRDPKWAFITGILYLARRHDSEAWGTQLFAVDEDQEARGAAPHWIDAARCRLVTEVAFKPNRLLLFLNSVGAHGAHIPEDAQPETLERYIYQFRIAPTVDSMAKLKATLPEDRRALWAGKAADY